jgi:hypothetical protein
MGPISTRADSVDRAVELESANGALVQLVVNGCNGTRLNVTVRRKEKIIPTRQDENGTEKIETKSSVSVGLDTLTIPNTGKGLLREIVLGVLGQKPLKEFLLCIAN